MKEKFSFTGERAAQEEGEEHGRPLSREQGAEDGQHPSEAEARDDGGGAEDSPGEVGDDHRCAEAKLRTFCDRYSIKFGDLSTFNAEFPSLVYYHGVFNV